MAFVHTFICNNRVITKVIYMCTNEVNRHPIEYVGGHSFITYAPKRGTGSSALRMPMYFCHNLCVQVGWVGLKSGNLCVRNKSMAPSTKEFKKSPYNTCIAEHETRPNNIVRSVLYRLVSGGERGGIMNTLTSAS